MMYTTVHRRMFAPHVCAICTLRVGRCMRATKEKWNNDVSFNASVAIFYLRITRDNGHPAYEYMPRPWYRVTHACAHTTRTRIRAHKHAETHPPLCSPFPVTNAPLCNTYTCGEHAYIRDTPLTFHPAAVSFGDVATAAATVQVDAER